MFGKSLRGILARPGAGTWANAGGNCERGQRRRRRRNRGHLFASRNRSGGEVVPGDGLYSPRSLDLPATRPVLFLLAKNRSWGHSGASQGVCWPPVDPLAAKRKKNQKRKGSSSTGCYGCSSPMPLEGREAPPTPLWGKTRMLARRAPDDSTTPP